MSIFKWEQTEMHKSNIQSQKFVKLSRIGKDEFLESQIIL
jgi:hypothetical protein